MPPFAVTLVLVSTLLHASWNILAKRSSATPALFPRVLLAITIPGLLFALPAEWRGAALLPHLWPLLLATGAFQAAYFLGLTMAYRAGDLSLVYPLVRALPVLLVGLFDVMRDQAPDSAGWLGLVLVLCGCLLVALPVPLRETGSRVTGAPAASRRWPRAAIGWAAFAALGTVGYTIFDKLAADVITAQGGAGARAAFRYGVWEFTASTAYFLPLLAFVDRRHARRPPPPRPSLTAGRARPARIQVIVLIGALMYLTYALVLWAYQLSWQTSYVVALRQFSIVVGVVVGSLLLGETAPALRIAGAVVIVAGVAVLAFAGGR